MWNKIIIIKNIMIMETKEKKVLGEDLILFQLNKGYSINKIFEEVTNIFEGFIDPLYIVNYENEIGFIF